MWDQVNYKVTDGHDVHIVVVRQQRVGQRLELLPYAHRRYCSPKGPEQRDVLQPLSVVRRRQDVVRRQDAGDL